jgi:hypothetical protein
LVDVLSPRPAVVADQSWNWLAWNDAADCLLEFDLDTTTGTERNTLRDLFLGKHRMPEADWEAYARLLVGRLRASLQFSGEKRWFEELVETMMAESEDFKRIWNRYEVADVSETPHIFHHSEFGRVSAEVLTLLIPAIPGACIIIFLPDDAVLGKLQAKLASRSARIR